MKKVFVDTVYWIAIANPKDQWRQAAEDAREQLGNARFVTTEEVLTEFLTALSKRPRLRDIAGRVVRGILGNPNVKVIPQSRDSFQKGLRRYEERQTKDTVYKIVFP